MGKRSNSLAVMVLALLPLSCATTPADPSLPAKPFSFSILEDYDKGEALQRVAADFALFRELGVTTWRGSFGWDDYEPARGEYDFDWLHRFADLAARHGIALRPYVGYTPAWAAGGGRDEAPWNDPPARIEEWRRFVFRLASAMKRHANVLSFEIYNEQNAPLWWDGSAEQYVQVLQAGSEAVRAAQGDDQVLMGGITYPDLAWMERLCAASAGRAFDILPLHAYPETWMPEEVQVENYLDARFFHQAFLPYVDDTCGRKPVWINEAGFATTPGKRTEEDQANWWARAIATFAADPRVEHLGIYEIRDRGAGAVIGEPENHFLGLTYSDGRRKLAFHTVKRLVGLLDQGSLVVADGQLGLQVTAATAGQLHGHLFILPDGRQVLILWDKRGSPVVQARLARPGSRVTEYALDGSGLPYPHFGGRTLRAVRLAPGHVRIFEILP